MNHSIDVLIPTFGRPDLVENLVKQIRNQSVEAQSITFLDDTPGTEIEDLADELGVNYLRNPGRPSLTRSRNMGIDATNGELIVFLDSDVVIQQDYLARMSALFADPREPTAVQGFVPNDWNHAGWKRIPLWLMGQGINAGTRMRFRLPFRNTFPHAPKGISESEWLSGANMVFHRERLGSIRFDSNLERYCLGEDLEMGLQLAAAGKVMLLDADTIVEELNDDEGRIVHRDLERMRIVNTRYILQKHFPARRRKLGLLYQDLGWLVQKHGLGFPSAWARYFRDKRQYKRLQGLQQWNEWYGFWSKHQK